MVLACFGRKFKTWLHNMTLIYMLVPKYVWFRNTVFVQYGTSTVPYHKKIWSNSKYTKIRTVQTYVQRERNFLTICTVWYNRMYQLIGKTNCTNTTIATYVLTYAQYKHTQIFPWRNQNCKKKKRTSDNLCEPICIHVCTYLSLKIFRDVDYMTWFSFLYNISSLAISLSIEKK